MLHTIKQFLTEGVWRIDESTQPWWMRGLIKSLRFLLLTCRCYWRDGSILHASALTYITMLAVVPVLTLGITSLKAFGAGDLAERKLMENIDSFVGRMEIREEAQPPLPLPAEDVPSAPGAEPVEATPKVNADGAQAAQALRDICKTIFDQINSINFAKIGLVGAVVLICMVVSVIGKIENSFNAIWGVSKARPLWRKFTDYLSVIIVVPLLVLAATSLPVLDSITRLMPSLWGLHDLLQDLGFFASLISLALGTLLFAFLFGFLPNIRVRVSSCFLGALITTLVLALFFKLCMVLQVGVASYSRLYGSLIALPILLFWIYSSWQIILFGAEICYVHQHRAELLRESAFSHPSERDIIILALALVIGAARCVDEDGQALSVAHFADTFALPEREVRRVAAILERSRILLPVVDNGESGEEGYVLSRCATRLSVADVINACLDNTPGEAVLQRAIAIDRLKPLASLEKRFSQTLTSQFPMTIAEVLQAAEEPREKA